MLVEELLLFACGNGAGDTYLSLEQGNFFCKLFEWRGHGCN